MKNSIYQLAKKYFIKLFIALIISSISFATGCKTNRTETATDRKLIKTDTATLDAWELAPGRNKELQPYRVTKKNNRWLISVNGGEAAETDTAYLRRSLQHISNLKAVTELNIPEKNWDTLGVTDKDTRLTLYKSGKAQQQLFLGNMFFKENKTTYYVRLKDENEIYTVQTYLEGSFKVPAEKLRKKNMVDVQKQQISEIMFLRPDGIEFSLRRAGQHNWSIDGILTKDSLTEQYVNALTGLTINNFAESPVTGADLSIQILTYGGKQVSLKAYRKNSDTWIISSTANTGNYIELPASQIQSMFPGWAYFMQSGK